MGEKDRMRGFGSPSFCSEVRTPSPQPSPLWGEGGVSCASFCGLSWQAFSFSRRVISAFTRVFDALWRASFSARERALEKMCSHLARNRSGPRKGQGVGPAFQSSVPDFVARVSEATSGDDGAASPPLPGSRFAHPGYEIIEGSGTPANAG
jgi:hypothetical protein